METTGDRTAVQGLQHEAGSMSESWRGCRATLCRDSQLEQNTAGFGQEDNQTEGQILSGSTLHSESVGRIRGRVVYFFLLLFRWFHHCMNTMRARGLVLWDEMVDLDLG